MRISLLLLAACAPAATTTTISGGPRGLRASEHVAVAAQEAEVASDRRAMPAPVMIAVGGPDVRDQPIAMPWYRSWDSAEEHERLAQIHRSAAAAIDAEYSAACSGLDEAAVSPIVRYGVGAWRVSSGAIVYLSTDAGPPEKLLARIRCHRAFMMLAPAGMDDCPLDLPDIALDARGDASGITLSITVRNARLVPELQRRVAHDLEARVQR